MSAIWAKPDIAVKDRNFRRWSSMMTSVLAQNNAPYYQVAAINVIDKEGYEASGVDKVRDIFKANGGKLIGGGYNKAVAIDSDVPAVEPFFDLDVPE
jgi:hypothetical protein